MGRVHRVDAEDYGVRLGKGRWLWHARIVSHGIAALDYGPTFYGLSQHAVLERVRRRIDRWERRDGDMTTVFLPGEPR
jgi:hypothetical protein